MAGDFSRECLSNFIWEEGRRLPPFKASALSEDLKAIFKEAPEGIPIALALQIYANQFKGTFLKCLKSIFPVTRDILSPHLFHAASKKYLTSCFESCRDLNDFGKDFPEFLAFSESVQSVQSVQKERPYLKDLATFEWHWNYLCFKRPQDPTKSIDIFLKELGKPVRLHFRLPFFLLKSPFPITQIFTQRKGDPRESQAMNNFLLFRPQHIPRFKEIPSEQALFLEGLFSFPSPSSSFSGMSVTSLMESLTTFNSWGLLFLSQ